MALIGVEPGSGRTLWSYPFRQTFWQQSTVTPAVVDGVIVISGEGRPLLGLQPRRVDGAWRVEERWRNRRHSLNLTSPLHSGGLIYALSSRDRGRLFSLDPANGEVLWEGAGRTAEFASLVATPAHILVLTSGAQLSVFDAGTVSGQSLASYSVADSPTWAHPVPLDGGILIKDAETLSLWSW